MLNDKYLREDSWEVKAKKNPLYAVMSVSEFAQSGSQPTAEEWQKFFESGRIKVQSWFRPWFLETSTVPEMKVLEFGCGMGRLLKSVEKLHPPHNLAGIDVSQTMIDKARPHLHKDVSLVVPDKSGRFPFADGHFDRVYSYAVFQHISSTKLVMQSIQEMCRVLKDGGKLKVQFEMVSPPTFGLRQRVDSFAFGSHSLVHGWTRRLGLPLWGVRLLRADQWSGVRLGYAQIVKAFQRGGVSVYGVVREPRMPRLVWFYGEKCVAP